MQLQCENTTCRPVQDNGHPTNPSPSVTMMPIPSAYCAPTFAVHMCVSARQSRSRNAFDPRWLAYSGPQSHARASSLAKQSSIGANLIGCVRIPNGLCAIRIFHFSYTSIVYSSFMSCDWRRFRQTITMSDSQYLFVSSHPDFRHR